MANSFPPLVNEQCHILLLGTMPGAESLRRQEYYANKSNHFWKIMFALLGANLTGETTYEEKTGLLLDNRIALWDVLASCERNGSADCSIKNEHINDFDAFYACYPLIKHVFFTSRKAEEYYAKHAGRKHDLIFNTLPSPSSANARKNLSEKIADWQIILSALSA
jgi:hypoxanthine-DNA glycosylase